VVTTFTPETCTSTSKRTAEGDLIRVRYKVVPPIIFLNSANQVCRDGLMNRRNHLGKDFFLTNPLKKDLSLCWERDK
jgi:hypothetical protein